MEGAAAPVEQTWWSPAPTEPARSSGAALRARVQGAHADTHSGQVYSFRDFLNPGKCPQK